MISFNKTIGISVFIAVWAAAGFLWLNAFPPPIELMGGDAVRPEKVVAGGSITITRSYRIIRSEPINVVRSMIRGDCQINCEIRTLPGATVVFRVGEYKNIDIVHTIPADTHPGKWRLVFTVQWQGRFGRYANEPFADLEIEVLPK